MTGLEKAPLQLYSCTVRPDWIDYLGHMNEGYYVVAFSRATDALLDEVGLGKAYREKKNCGMYTVESHVAYLREAHEAAEINFSTVLLGVDAKRIHIFHYMYTGGNESPAATLECVLLHVDQTEKRVTQMPREALMQLERIRAAHAALSIPSQLNRIKAKRQS